MPAATPVRCAWRRCGYPAWTKVFYAYSNEDGAPFGLSTAAIYQDLARPFAAQSMTIRHVPARPEGQADLYAAWAEAQDELKQGKLKQGKPK